MLIKGTYVACKNGSLRNARRYLMISWYGIADTDAKKQAIEILSALESLCTTINSLGGVELEVEDNSDLTDKARAASKYTPKKYLIQ